MDLISYIEDQKIWSVGTFGPGNRDEGIIDHIKKELVEIKENPGDLEEWIDVIILALDGAWRNGHTAKNIAGCLRYKQIKNRLREWPDWRTAEPGKAIEHVRGGGRKIADITMPVKPLCFGLRYADNGTCCINCPHGHKCHVVMNQRSEESKI